jgi:hypothetical protein
LVQGYDPASGKLYQVSDQVGSYNLATIQAGAEVIFDLSTFLDHPGWQRMWLQYCRLGSAPAEVLLRDKDTGNEGADGRYVGEQGAASQGTPRLAAYAYAVTRNPAFAKPAVASLPPVRRWRHRDAAGRRCPHLDAVRRGAAHLDQWRRAIGPQRD